jgi:hypothetical protein
MSPPVVPTVPAREKLVVWGSDCRVCGNATPGSQRCDECHSDEHTIPLWVEQSVDTALPGDPAMTTLPGIPPPHALEARRGCEHGCVNGQVESPESTESNPIYHPCPIHNPALFRRWAAGEVGRWRATESTEPRRATR